MNHETLIELRATARMQLHAGFTLDDATALVGYFADLGVSHFYASPLTSARPGSLHGYDVIDPTRINPELGGEAALQRLVHALRERQMGLIVDIVPNHMAVSDANPWWHSVLAWGVTSPYADFFDINWHSADALMDGRLLAPFLGRDYAKVLDAGELLLDFDVANGTFSVNYFDNRFPLTPPSYADILHCSDDLRLNELAVRFAALEGSRQAPEQAQHLCKELAQLCVNDAQLDHLRQAMKSFRHEDLQGNNRLHALLERQHYRLANWRTAADEINWRRFFDVNELVSLKIESPEVFEAAHVKIFDLVERGLIDGLRIDHIDGLADPHSYCRRLRRRIEGLPGHPPGTRFPIYVEKILGDGEALPVDWQVDGTTGYEFMNQVSLLQHDPQGAPPLQQLWAIETTRPADFLQEVYEARRLVLTHSLAADFETVAQGLMALARMNLDTRDLTLNSIRRVLLELIANFSVYRTYAAACGRSEQDCQYYQQAALAADQRLCESDKDILAALDHWLGGESFNQLPPGPERRLRQRVLRRFHQLTSPAAAKAVEDTAFYRSGVLLSRNDVGFDPGHFSALVEAFHNVNLERNKSYPRSLLATATHDHKRGEDTRARLAVISERAPWYIDRVRQWKQLAAPLRSSGAGVRAPSAGDELMLYQTLLGSWPLDLESTNQSGMRAYFERVAGWQQKALREAKLLSSWSTPNSPYEDACREFLAVVLLGSQGQSLRAQIADAAADLAPAGALNSLAQSLLRLTVPGVPDLYQGAEFWDFSLVDPDNRRPVDYSTRQAAFAEEHSANQLLENWKNGRIKQQLIGRALDWRREHASLFRHGNYQPLQTIGEHANKLCAFAREYEDRSIIVVVPVLVASLLGDASDPLVPAKQWGDTAVQLPAHLHKRRLENLLAAETVMERSGQIAASELLARFPVGFISVQSDGLEEHQS
ncbi:malto-oligosyltrehalose synthase [Halopseudomonas salina]|uniref:Malto-oligosyltrehalose synthase n=1 Tax=Halopseudomonas salina TaxID=1323744 RepID=A0ABQ1NWU8_9GAMM|nr:malto-oligosyltrehalose synthase [Halopseudomonas salina]GGC86788.1 malto-oligosyltrehalose synthase [Halopseudomonas salina]